ncbi:T9SS type A sorting domain-containing protein [bacterium]|nr:T9SS type A sorting domain-containing protein [bacterium]
MRYFILLIIFIAGTTASAEIHYVSPGESIQSAVLLALDLDTVLVEDGVYEESVVLYGRTITLASRFLLDGDTTHITNTIIRPWNPDADTASCLIYGSNEAIEGKVVGLTLADGRGTTSFYRPEFRVGGCIHIRNSVATIEDCRITDGRAFVGGGITVEGEQDTCFTVSAILNNVVIKACHAEDSGGGVFVWRGSAIITNCTFENDSCSNLHGGLQCLRSHTEVDECEFRHCYGWKGGMEMQQCTGHVRYCLFEQNGARPINFGYCHFSSINSPIEFSGNILRDGATNHFAAGWSGSPAPRVFGNVIENNVSTYLTATVLIGWYGETDFAYNIIRNNLNNHGGAVQAFQETDARIHHNVIKNNRDLIDNFGSGFMCVSGCRPTLDSNLFIENQGVAAGWGFNEETHMLDMRNNWWGDASGPYHPTYNPHGLGDTLLSDSILFIPWLTAAPDTAMPTSISDRERPEQPGTWHIMNLFPNPFNSEFTIILAGFTRSDFSLRLYDILGREAAVIQQGALTGGRLSFRAPPELASGVYFLRAADRSQVDTRKVVLLK